MHTVGAHASWSIHMDSEDTGPEPLEDSPPSGWIRFIMNLVQSKNIGESDQALHCDCVSICREKLSFPMITDSGFRRLMLVLNASLVKVWRRCDQKQATA
jgi:hypothetical protein